jgi:hypothetical protein
MSPTIHARLLPLVNTGTLGSEVPRYHGAVVGVEVAIEAFTEDDQVSIRSQVDTAKGSTYVAAAAAAGASTVVRAARARTHFESLVGEGSFSS